MSNNDQVPLDLDEKRTEAWNTFQELQSAIKNQISLFLVVGRILKDFRDNHLYKYIGEGGNDNFKQFLNGLGMTMPTAYLYIRVYEYYIEKLKYSEEKIREIPLNRLMRLLPSLKKLDDEEAKKIIDEVAPLTHGDYSQEVKERKLETPRPKLRRHKECQKFIFEYNPNQMCDCEGSSGIIDVSMLD